MEYRDLYDENKNLTGEKIAKADPIPANRYILVVTIVIENSKGELLLQKRSKDKGGQWALTGGHPKTGETSLDGIITEVDEEIGIRLDPKNVKLFGSYRDKSCFRDFYYTRLNIDPSTLVLQEEEVTDCAWFTCDEVKKLIAKGDFFSKGNMVFEKFLEIKDKELSK